ncbi:MAG: hypothetical protein LBL24_04200 [Bacteroidales bacterium]|jgi:hypothetical protein|nr:hypothetical protein [Bacteroidales bacterium]
MSKSFENFLQAMFSKSPNGTPFAEREREREREREDSSTLNNKRARGLAKYSSSILYRRYIVSYDVAAFYMYPILLIFKNLKSWQSKELS